MNGDTYVIDPRIQDVQGPDSLGAGGCDCTDCQVSVAELFDARDAAAGIVRVDTHSDETVERIARALHAVEYGTWSETASPDHNKWTWDGANVTDYDREQCRIDARAVLTSLRD